MNNLIKNIYEKTSELIFGVSAVLLMLIISTVVFVCGFFYILVLSVKLEIVGAYRYLKLKRLKNIRRKKYGKL